MRRLRTSNKRQRRADLNAIARLPSLATIAPPRPAPASNDETPIETVAVAGVPGGGQLRLARCGDAFSIQSGADELMGSQDHVSEEALATLTYARLANGDGPVLIGGLGMGFTLRAVLSACGPSARIVVAELVPELLDWARGPLAHLFGACLDDPRVSVALADVHDLIDEADATFDAILLDVDNGPDGFIRPENDRLYCPWGLRAAHAALRPGGVLAVWSAYPDPAFRDRLADTGFGVDEVDTPAFAGSEHDHHTLWFATKPPRPTDGDDAPPGADINLGAFQGARRAR